MAIYKPAGVGLDRTGPIRITTDDGRTLEKNYEELFDAFTISVHNGLNECMDAVAFAAVGNFMIKTAGIVGAATKPVHPTKLTIRSGRLAKAVKDNYRYSSVRLPSAGKINQQKPKTLKLIGGKKEGFRKIKYAKRKGFFGEMGVDKVPYAALHEYGGDVTRGTKAGRSGGFNISGTAHYPERSYLRAGLALVKNKFWRIMEKHLGDAINRLGWR